MQPLFQKVPGASKIMIAAPDKVMGRLVPGVLLILLFGGGTPFAQLPVARLLTVFPPGGKTGSQFEVTLTGADLDEASELHFSHAGITGKQKAAGTNASPEPNKFVVTVATNVAPGVYDVRVVGRFGISNPRSFVVSDLPEIIAPATDNSFASAATISLDTIINGRSEANAFAFYKFAARKGQRILIECQARELDSRMEAALILLDSAGKELQRSRSGGLLDFTPPVDGEYHLKVYDFIFRGGGEYFYRLTLTTRPHIDFIFPPSGLAGTKGKYLLYGRNLPGSIPAYVFSGARPSSGAASSIGARASASPSASGPSEAAAPEDGRAPLTLDGKPLEQLEVEIELPREPTRQFSSPQILADSALDAFEYRLSTPHGLSNPVLLSFATAPLVAEREPNNQPAQANSISPPCEYVAQFYPAGDQDWVTFEARKGDVFWVEVFSERLGLPTDPFVLIQRVAKDDKGEEKVSDVKELNDTDSTIGGVEYKTATRDPSGRFEVEESGAYRIQVRDMFDTSQPDPRLVYRLSIRKEAPDFRLVAVAQPPPSPNKDAKEALLWTPLLRRGETMPIKVMAFRRDNFSGEIEIKAENLPAGVTCNEAKIEKDKSSTMLLLTAAENAAAWVGRLKIVGKAKLGDTQVSRRAHSATLNWTVSDYNAEAIQSRLSRDSVLAVSGVETAPISIEPSETKPWETSETGKLSIPLKVIRRTDFNASLKLKALGLSSLDKLKEIEVDGKATNATVEIDLAEHKIPPGTHNFYLQTQTPGKYRNNPEAAKAADEALKQAEKLIVDLTAALKKAPEVKQAAIKTAADSAAKAKAASEAVAGPAKAAADADALTRAASGKLAAAKAALEAKPDDQDLLAAEEAAVKAAEEAELKAKAALEAKLIAEKAAAEAQAKAKADAEAQAAAEKAETEGPAKLKDAEKSKELAATRAKETAKTAEPRDVTVTVYSAPINLKIIASSSSPAK